MPDDFQAACVEAVGESPYVGYKLGVTVARNILRANRASVIEAVAAKLADHPDVFHAGNRTLTVDGNMQDPKAEDTVAFKVDLAANDQGKLLDALAALKDLGFNP